MIFHKLLEALSWWLMALPIILSNLFNNLSYHRNPQERISSDPVYEGEDPGATPSVFKGVAIWPGTKWYVEYYLSFLSVAFEIVCNTCLPIDLLSFEHDALFMGPFHVISILSIYTLFCLTFH